MAETKKGGDFDMHLKLLLLGDSAVGKTSLLMRFCDDKFSPTFISTVGVDYKAKILPIEGERVKLQVWDTAGQERFRTISVSFLRGAQGIALVFDLTDPKSFVNVRSWMKQVSEHTDGSISMVLLANKADMVDRRAVSDDEIAEVAKGLNVQVFYTSAKTGEQVAEAFESLARTATRRILESKPKATGAGGSGAGTGGSGASKATSGGGSGTVDLKAGGAAAGGKATGCGCG